jgi:hypothetical protein
MVLMYPGEMAEKGAMPDPELITKMMKFNEEMQKAGILVALDGLQPSAKGARVRFKGGKPSVQDGPFAEAKELVGGYWMIDVRSKEEAIEWVKRCPVVGDEMIEIRQVFEMSDFPQATPEARAKADEIGKNLPKQN